MPKGNTLSRLALVSLAAAALAAPAASAQPIMDMHASTVHKPAPATQDLRGEAASDSSSAPISRPSVPAKADLRGEAAADTAVKPVKVDLRGEAAADAPRAPGSRLSDPGPRTWPAYPTPTEPTPASRPALPGPPTWPVSPTPLKAPSAAVVADDGDGGIDIPTSVLIIAGTLVAAGGLTVAALRHRPRVAH